MFKINIFGKKTVKRHPENKEPETLGSLKGSWQFVNKIKLSIFKKDDFFRYKFNIFQRKNALRKFLNLRLQF